MTDERKPTGVRRCRSFIAWTIVIPGLIAAGCGDDTPKTARKVDACELVTVEDIQNAIGVRVTQSQKPRTAGGGEDQGFMSACLYTTPGEPEGVSIESMKQWAERTVHVNVTVWSWPPKSKGADAYMTNALKVGEKPNKEISGLGQKAVWNGNLHVRQGDFNIIVSVFKQRGAFGDGEDIAKETALAKIVLNRLPN